MKTRERFIKTLNFDKSVERLPQIEWAPWWNETIERWENEGFIKNAPASDTYNYFGLDQHKQFWISPAGPDCPAPSGHGMGIIENEADYERIKKYLYSKDAISRIKDSIISIKKAHEDGDLAVWISLEGFFWFPRTLFGIENHLYAFYDYPELMHKINKDNSEYCLFLIEEFSKITTPDFMTFAEDMSYNHGPMLSEEIFNEFLKPYYKAVIPTLKSKNISVFIDSDGEITTMLPWLIDSGIEGILPLERQSGVDVNKIRNLYPNFKMIGGFDKMIMHLGEDAMRAEFERILPVMKSGGYIPGVDHQTPPSVSLENYKIYVKLLKEYCEKACSN